MTATTEASSRRGEREAISPQSFQEACLAETERLLRQTGVETTFESVRGEAEVFLKAAFSYGQKALEVYIYEDEAGFYEDGEWLICESQDFDGDGALIRCFIHRLSKALRA
jgi:hypothetical protein